MSTIFWDAETFSSRNLPDCGSHVYSIDPSTDIFFFCFAVDDGEVQVWRPGDPVPEPFADPTKHTFIADNWTFERAILEHILIPRYHFVPIPIANMACAQRLALMNGFPPELGLRCRALDLPYEKDPEARKAMLRLTRPSKRKRKKPEDPGAREHDLELLLQRCKTDVAMTRACCNHPRIRPLPPEEWRVLLLDAAINARGVCANVPFLTAADALAIGELGAINLRVSELTGGTVTTINQTERIKDAVNARGHNMTTLNKRSVAAVLAHKPEDFTREILTLRQRGAFISALKFKTLLEFADPVDHRIRDVLRYHGAGPGRWTALGAQTQNLTRNDDDLPATLVAAVIAGNRAEVARYGNPLRVISQLSRASLCAIDGYEFHCADLSSVESRVNAWCAGETWKLEVFRKYDATGDPNYDFYRINAHFMLKKGADVPVSEITAAERQPGKYIELAAGFGGSIGAWRRIAGDDGRSDEEIKGFVKAWRGKHPATRMFWGRLMRAAITAIHLKRTVEVNPPPLPRITAAFDGYALTLTLPSGRVINYPGARIAANTKFADGDPDIEFFDNARGKWQPTRAWFGTLVENVVQGTARDLLAAAIVRAEARGWKVVHHCHDEIVVEAPIGTISGQDVLALLIEPPPWAVGLSLGGKVRSGPLYLDAPATGEPSAAQATAEPELDVADADTVEKINADILRDDVCLTVLDEMRVATGPHVELAVELPDDRTRTQCNDPKLSNASDGALNLTAWESRDTAAITGTVPLFEQSGLSTGDDGFTGFTTDVQGFDKGKINCPFHEDKTPSCQLYADGHYHCFGCGAHGWIAEDMDLPEDVLARVTDAKDDTHTLERGLELFAEGTLIGGTLAERYFIDTRKLDPAAFPADDGAVLRFHPRCPFGGNGARQPCLLALFRDVESDAPAGIHRIGLTAEAKKIRRLTLGRYPRPRAIKLWPAIRNELTIGEGIETVLGALLVGAIKLPAWAMGPKADIANFPVLPGIEKITILVDRGDAAALDGAEVCAGRYVAAGRKARWLRTVRVKDFNDLTMTDRRAA